ncbi:MAG TPA: glycosyltransferase family 9 protein [Armatimonadota bacterium]|nr:glycosyltransferase family 9 protein [Armatimonadota bacterium]
MGNVLVIRFSSLGDVVMTSAVIEALSVLPEQRVTLLTRASYAPVFSADPRLAGLIGIEGGESPRAISALAGDGIDTVVDLHDTLRSRAVSALVKAPLKLRVDKHALARRLMIWTRNRFRRSFDVLGSYLETVRPLGVTGRTLPRLFIAEQARAAAETLLATAGVSGGRVIGIAPGSRHGEKRWGAESYAVLADLLLARGDVPVFIGDSDDAEYIGVIAAHMHGAAPSLAGKADLGVTAALISRLDGLVCNDSGPMHLAGALGTPCAAIFGPTHPDLGFVPGYPRGAVLHSGVPCSPCSLHGSIPCRLGTHRCMVEITPNQVFHALDEMRLNSGSQDYGMSGIKE